MVKKFTIPFASQGDANDIPDALQVDGRVSFTQGFGYDYERPYDDPQAKDIAREDMNGLFKAITSAVGELQTLGASEWSDAIAYPKGAIVYFEKDLYISQVDDNQNTPPQSWVSITSIANDSLKKAANLSDLTNKTTARNNLGLGSSATLNKTDVLGTSTNLVATQKLVNDTKINLDNSIRAVDTFANKVNDKTDLLEVNKRSISNNHFPQTGITIGNDTGWHSTLSDGLEKDSYNFAITHVSGGQQTGYHMFDKNETGVVATREFIPKNTAYKSNSGWWKCADTGLIMQWGVGQSGSAVNFPIAFPSNVLRLVVSQSSGTETTPQPTCVKWVNTTSFQAFVRDLSTTDSAVAYIAIGY